MKLSLRLLVLLALCAGLAVSAFAYPAGIDESLPRVADNAGLLTTEETQALGQRIRELTETYKMDIVLLTQQSIGGKTPGEYADDYFDYQGYGWREEETDDITTGSGILVLIAVDSRDLWFSTKGRGMEVFGDEEGGSLNHFYSSMTPYLARGSERWGTAFERFLDEAQTWLEADANGVAPGVTNGYHGASNGGSGYVSPAPAARGIKPATVLFAGLLIAFFAALAAVLRMRAKMNTARAQRAAGNYMRGDSFRLTQQQDTFLYSNTTKVRIDTDSGSGGHSSGGGSYHSGGSHTSSSGSTHGGGGGKF